MHENELIKAVLPYSKYAHGFFSAMVILLFFYQGSLGLRMRSRRRSGVRPEARSIRRHRKFGPVLVILVISGFSGGIASVFLQWQDYFMYPVHFLNGLTVISLAAVTFLVSRKIRAKETTWRTVHYFIGVLILILLILQAYFGIRMLFAL